MPEPGLVPEPVLVLGAVLVRRLVLVLLPTWGSVMVLVPTPVPVLCSVPVLVRVLVPGPLTGRTRERVGSGRVGKRVGLVEIQLPKLVTSRWHRATQARTLATALSTASIGALFMASKNWTGALVSWIRL